METKRTIEQSLVHRAGFDPDRKIFQASDALADALAALPCGDWGVFVAAMMQAQAQEAAFAETPLLSLLRGEDDFEEVLRSVEREASAVCSRDNGVWITGDASVGFRIPMNLLLPEGERELFCRAGANFALLLRPQEGIARRLSLEVQKIRDEGFDLSHFERVRVSPARRRRKLPRFGALSVPSLVAMRMLGH